MPFEIPLSQLQNREQFEQAVAEHADKLAAFTRTTGEPRPVAHPMIEASIKRISHPKSAKLPDDYVVDYVIVDDTPPPPPPLNLADRKALLHGQLRAAEQAAKEAVLPQRKHRLLFLQAQNASRKIKFIEGKQDESDLTAEEQASLVQVKTVQDTYANIELLSAQAESDIEELTDDTVDTWQVPNFG